MLRGHTSRVEVKKCELCEWEAAVKLAKGWRTICGLLVCPMCWTVDKELGPTYA